MKEGRQSTGALQRKREIDRKYLHQVEITLVSCLGENRALMEKFCEGRVVATRRYYAQRNGGEFLTWCFAKREDARAFLTTFGGKYLKPSQHSGQRLSLHYDSKTILFDD